MQPNPPGHLKTDGADLYRALAEQYRIDDAAGLSLLCVAAECLDRMRAAQAAIAKHGAVISDRRHQVKVNPACQLEKDARNGFLAALNALNLGLAPLHDVGRP